MKIDLGLKLKILRTTHCISQKVIADQIGISIPAYSKIETGQADISFQKLQQIADLYKISMLELIKIGEKDNNEVEYPNMKRQLDDVTQAYNLQQKKIIQLYEIIRAHSS